MPAPGDSWALRGVWGWGSVKDVTPTRTLRGAARPRVGTDGPELASPCPRRGDMGTRGGCGQPAPVGPLGGQRMGRWAAAAPRSREGILEPGTIAAGRGPRARPRTHYAAESLSWYSAALSKQACTPPSFHSFFMQSTSSGGMVPSSMESARLKSCRPSSCGRQPFATVPARRPLPSSPGAGRPH